MPARVGFAAMCITVILSVSSIGYCETKEEAIYLYLNLFGAYHIAVIVMALAIGFLVLLLSLLAVLFRIQPIEEEEPENL